ncbi:Ca2+-dependent phosphoinositide-specific phospholipase C [Microterricola viridarii]|uniref:Phosphoinositide phospholipase C, Ca2+-dependent n=1 Tax=Microterricola viridarii TaxID=412690 RepID=A0A1H1UGA4_9MICO|nr:Ca2+-dependent phosphoinositide-specific phospholipase C [Microterricola viridarii]SDS71468.1 Phosphoinositide phospholipase C, Ca2+-dependent [Microterricola viridarii]
MTPSTDRTVARPRALRNTLLVLGSALGVLVLAAAATLVSFLLLGWQSSADQIARFEAHQADVAALPQSERDAWVDTAGDPTVTETLPFNELQTIATHNSYVQEPTWLQLQVLDLFDPGQAVALQYGHAPLWDQLEAGIRSLEIDVRWNGESFEASHVPLVANRSTMPDFALGLREIALWSEAHPAHLPISIMLEPKADYLFLDPALKPFDTAACAALDATVTDALGDRLFTPGDLQGEGPSLREAVAATGWPSVAEMRGSVLFFYAENKRARELCFDGDANNPERAIFASSHSAADDAVFAVRDDPWDPAVAADLTDGILVRLRADADLKPSEEGRNLAFATGAQIVSTDFPPGAPEEGTGYSAVFPGGYLARAAGGH